MIIILEDISEKIIKISGRVSLAEAVDQGAAEELVMSP